MPRSPFSILPPRARLAIGIVLWLAVSAAGLKALLDYQTAPGSPAKPPAAWPASAGLPRHGRVPSLLVFAHPHCACTRATLEELARIMARAKGGAEAQVIFIIPKGRDTRWAETDLYRAASAIPGVHTCLDLNGEIAGRFGVATSGQALLYGTDGRLRFAGGITPGRGHEGDNAGSDAIVSILASHPATLASTPVFGCALASPTSEAERGGRPKWAN